VMERLIEEALQTMLQIAAGARESLPPASR
jgi:hypothetical protein